MKRQNRKIPEQRFKEKSEDYKAEIRKLRKEVAQLRKENNRLINRDEGLQELFEEFGEHEAIADNEATTHRAAKFCCPHCGSSELKFMSFRYEDSHYSCVSCGKAGPVK